MLKPSPLARMRGFTMVELMIAVAIIFIVLLLGIPSYRVWIQNTQIRTATESVQNGLQLARAEAVRRNAKVQFVLTDTDPTQDNVSTVAASTAGKNWMVRVFQTGGTYTTADFIQGRSGGEGSSNAVVAAGQSSFVFNGLGRLTPVPAATVNIDISNPNGGDRPLRVMVSVGGLIRMCDPALTLSSNPQGCA